MARNLYFLSLGFNEGFVGLVVGVGTFTGLLVALPGGHLGDRFGPRKTMIGATALGAAGIALQGIPYRVPIVLGAALNRVAWSVFFIVGPALLTEESGTEERTHLFSVFSSSRRLALIPGALLGGYMPGLLGGLLGLGGEGPVSYRLTIFLQALLLAAALIPLFLIDSSPNGEVSSTSRTYDLEFLRQPLARKILLPSLLVGTGAGMIFPFLNVIFEHYGASTELIGWIFTIQSLLTGLFVLFAPNISKKWGKAKGVALTRLASIPFLLIVGYAGHVPVMAGALMVRSSLMRLSSPLRNNLLMNIARPGERSKINGIRQVASRIGRTAAGPVAGWILSNVSYSLPFLLTSVLYAVGSGLFYLGLHPLELEQEEAEN
uniref:Major facilitator superfamily MFS-1 n=1 Tax=uncultured organism TaxID=155900 RepID=M1P0G1_9ZZZZ|nr:major facilitator superfamily MFS-1 [uncultured organism]